MPNTRKATTTQSVKVATLTNETVAQLQLLAKECFEHSSPADLVEEVWTLLHAAMGNAEFSYHIDRGNSVTLCNRMIKTIDLLFKVGNELNSVAE